MYAYLNVFVQNYRMCAKSEIDCVRGGAAEILPILPRMLCMPSVYTYA